MNLEDKIISEIEIQRQEIKTDYTPMTIGELINLYKDGDLELSPIYQRLFRWDLEQKSRFIESIILGLPIPSIFVAQRTDNIWSVVDGLQRLSTILQFVGDLKDFNSQIILINTDIDNSFKLTGLKKLSILNGLSWKNLPPDTQRLIKRTKLNISIILLTKDNVQSQYEVFQRLNTGGLHLEAQEIRNCLIIMLNENLYLRLNELKNNTNFLSCIQITDNKLTKEYHMELILRYFIARRSNINWDSYNLSNISIDDLIDQETINLIDDINSDIFNLESEIKLFEDTFSFLNSLPINESIFKKYVVDKHNFEGQFLQSCYESILIGVAQNLEKLQKLAPNDFVELIKSMHSEATFIKYSSRGTRVPIRFKELTSFSLEFFKQ